VRRPAVFAASLACGLALAAFYHTLYQGALAREDDPWSTPAGYAGPTILNAGRITVELDHPAGLAPHPDAVARLDARIEDLTGQQVQVTVDEEAIASPAKATLTDVAALERRHRDSAHSGGGAAGLYILYLGGEYAEDAGVLGAAYLGYSVVVFRAVIGKAGTPRPNGECAGIIGPTPCEVERAVLVHEVGHLLGLVNINHDSKQDHWDEKQGHHCADQRCVMFWQIEVGGPLAGPPPDEFDPRCKADIAQIRAMWSGAPSRYWSDPKYVAAIALLLTAFAGIGAVLAWYLGPRKKAAPAPDRADPPPPAPPS
jgi:hypothetical protein